MSNKKIEPTRSDPEISRESVQIKRIGNTTYIITSRFNGNAKRNPSKSLIRMIEREFMKV